MAGPAKRVVVPEAAHLAPLLEEAISNLPLGLIVFNRKREVVFYNDRYLEICGLVSDQVMHGTPISGDTQHELILGLDEHRSEGIESVVTPTTSVREYTDGRVIAHAVSPMADGGGMITLEDISERRRLSARLKEQQDFESLQEEELRRRTLQFDTAINNMSQGLCFFDGAQRLIVCNDRYLEMYGLSRERVPSGTTLAEIVDMRFEAGSFPAMSKDEYLNWRNNVVISAEPTDSIVDLRDGRTFAIRHRPMPDSGWVATHEDITKQRRSEVKIAHMAHHDALTDLANRVLLNERLKDALARVRRNEIVAVHHIDLDRFKAVNDTLGHPAGDKLLKMVADRLLALVRDSDTIARMGGDEFAIVQVGMGDPTDATALAQRVIESMRESFDIDGHQVAIGASIGIVIGPGDGTSPDELLRNADLALYRAKGDGRGAFRFFESGMDLQMQARLIMEQDLRKAISGGEFELYYQPVVNLASKVISGFEALIRWNHPEKGMVSPGAFVPLAEETGLIIPIGEWVIRQACTTAAHWPQDFVVAINISAIQFRSPRLLQVIVGALAASGLPGGRLEIEITESVLLEDKETTLAMLHQLRGLGIRIAMDDFGIGYSSLTYLQCFPFDKIKIDRSFVKDITENAGSLNIVRAVAALANGMGMTTTAEGVETSEQLEKITSEGCTEMQGYIFSKPLPVDEIERLFVSGRTEEQIIGRTVAA